MGGKKNNKWMREGKQEEEKTFMGKVKRKREEGRDKKKKNEIDR